MPLLEAGLYSENFLILHGKNRRRISRELRWASEAQRPFSADAV